MVNNDPVASRRPRLNPFVFPSDTDFYFVLLLVAVLASNLFVYNALVNYFQPQQLIAAANCESQFHFPAGQSPSGQALTAMLTSASNGITQCRGRVGFLSNLLTWLMGGVSLVLAIAGVIYLVIPTWKLKREKLMPLSAEEIPEVAAYLAGLCQEAGLSRHPLFLWNPLNSTSSGLAFGRFGRYCVALSGGLMKQFYTDRPAFRAIILHELAHLRNADVNKTYFAVAIWWAFVVVTLVPFAVYMLTTLTVSRQDWFSTLNLVWRVLALTAFVYLSYATVLRTREVYADMRASVWDGTSGALARVLKALPHTERGWHTVLRFHPHPGERRRVLDETNHMFHTSLWQATGVGIAIGVALSNVERLLQAFFGWVDTWGNFFPAYLAEYLGTACIFAPLMVGVVGLGIWRSTFADALHNRVPKRADLVGLCLGLGVALGAFLSLSLENAVSTNVTTSFTSELPWLLLLLVSLPLFLWWIAAGASAWLGRTVTSKSPRLIYIMGLTIASVVLVGWLTLLFQFRFWSVFFFQSSIDFFSVLNAFIYLSLVFLVGVTLQEPLTLLALMSLWAFPLVAWLWRKQTNTIAVSSWAFLDTSPQPITLARRDSSGFRFALALGLVGGLIFCGLILIIRIWLHLSLPQEVRDSDLFRLAFGYGHFALAALLQAGIAAIVVSRIRYMGVLYSLFAAFVGGCVMTVATLGLNLLFGSSIDRDFAWQTFSFTVNGGALLALLTALGVSTLLKWRSRVSPQQRAFPSHFAIIAGLLSGLAFCAIALVISVYLSQLTVTLYVSGTTANEHTYLLGLRSALLFNRTLLAVLFQAATAAIVAVRVKQWRVLQGLLATLIGGCVMLVGILAADLLLGDLVNLSLILLGLWYVVASGMLLALPTALFASLLAGWRQQTVLHQQFFHARLALRIGLVGGLIFCLFVLFFTVCMPLIIPAKIGTTAKFVSQFYSSQISLAVLLQIAIAAIAACRVRRFGFLYSLFAAFIGGCAMAVGMLISRLLYGGIGLSLGWLINFSKIGASILFLMLISGVFLSLPVALVLSLLAKLVRRLQSNVIARAVTAPLT